MTRFLPEATGERYERAAVALLSAGERRRWERWIAPARPFATPSRPARGLRRLILLDSNGHRARFLLGHVRGAAVRVSRRRTRRACNCAPLSG
jgi:hypothetical protein